MIMIYYWDKRLKKKIACPRSWYNIDLKKNIDLMSRSEGAFFTGHVPNDCHCAYLSNKSVSLMGRIYFKTHCVKIYALMF